MRSREMDREQKIQAEFQQRWEADKAITISRLCDDIEALIDDPRYCTAVRLATSGIYSREFLAGGNSTSLLANIIQLIQNRILDDAIDAIEHRELMAENNKVIEETML